jgi:hypothetical protein
MIKFLKKSTLAFLFTLGFLTSFANDSTLVSSDTLSVEESMEEGVNFITQTVKLVLEVYRTGKNDPTPNNWITIILTIVFPWITKKLANKAKYLAIVDGVKSRGRTVTIVALSSILTSGIYELILVNFDFIQFTAQAWANSAVIFFGAAVGIHEGIKAFKENRAKKG